jgi:hypothetical protein
MNMNHVTFQAKLAQVTLSKTNKAVLELPEDMSFEKLAQIAKFRGASILIQFGNPQTGIEDFGIRVERPGLLFTAGPSGVVERIDSEEEDQEQIDITDVPDETESEQESDESETESEESEQDGFEIEYDNKKVPDQEPDPAEEDAERIEGKDELETFILNGKAPKYDDIPYDFPELLKRKMAGETWMVIATSLKVSSTTLSAAWSKYRKQVKAYMEGEEHGAA